MYVLKTFGRFWSFQAGWWLLMCNIANQVSFVLLALDYLATIVDLSIGARYGIAMGLIILIMVLNAMGLDIVGTLFLLTYLSIYMYI